MRLDRERAEQLLWWALWASGQYRVPEEVNAVMSPRFIESWFVKLKMVGIGVEV